MALVQDQRGAEVQITEEVVKAVAGNGKEVMALLLDQRGDEVQITAGGGQGSSELEKRQGGDGTAPGPARRRGPDHESRWSRQ